MYGLLLSVALYIRIGRLFDGLALLEQFDVLGKQFPVERVGVVEVNGLTLLRSHACRVVIVRVERNNCCAMRRQCLSDFSYDSCFSRAGSTGNSYDSHIN